MHRLASSERESKSGGSNEYEDREQIKDQIAELVARDSDLPGGEVAAGTPSDE